MTMHFFIRSVPLLVGVEAETEKEASKLAGERLDDFMTDAVNEVDCVSHVDESTYTVHYHGDAVYASALAAYGELNR